MKAPDKIYLPIVQGRTRKDIRYDATYFAPTEFAEENIEYIRKDALLEWVESEFNRLWELLPDADNPNPTQMELRYLGQYMQMEALEDKLNSM